MNRHLDDAGAHLLACCNQPRYRTAWLIGGPLAGKTTLARALCAAYGWRYLDYIEEPGFFDTLGDDVETYQPGDLLQDLLAWCEATRDAVLVVDELDALLATWSPQQQRLFATRASRLPNLPHGLVLVSNLFDEDTLAALLPESDLPAYFNLSGALP